MTGMRLKRAALRLAGWICLVVGAALAPTPLPVGLPMIALGLGLVLATSASARRGLGRLRARWPGFSGRIGRLEPYLPRHLRSRLRRTDPARRDRLRRGKPAPDDRLRRYSIDSRSG
ncbi:hypothetical protein P7L78_09915 [Tistrella bauzanensis]|uniref:hypothetical protein n=1 Tax=Tistrella TaxID=171436 RepID=UPI0031FAA79C